MASSCVGLEITEEEVRAAEVSTGRTLKILGHGAVRLPRGAAKDSEVLDRAAVATALQQLWKQAGFRSRRVVLGICSRRVLVRDYRTQVMAPEQLKQALPFQVADLLPVPVDQAVIDFYPVSQEQDQLSGLLVAAVAETVTEMVDTVARARLHVERVDLAPFGLLRAIGMLTDSAETVALVHLGLHTGYVVVAAQGVPHFVRIIPIELAPASPETEGPQAAQDGQPPQQPQPEPARAEQPAPGTAETPRDPMTLLFGDREPEPEPLAQERIDDLVSQVVDTMRFHVDRSQNRGIDRVILTGAGAGIPGVYTAFRNRLRLPVKLVGAHHLSQTDARARHGQEDLELLTTVGLAMQETRSWS
ncbi:type IV pilus biogenesis protein PilM [Leucobacter sp.]